MKKSQSNNTLQIGLLKYRQIMFFSHSHDLIKGVCRRDPQLPKCLIPKAGQVGTIFVANYSAKCAKLAAAVVAGISERNYIDDGEMIYERRQLGSKRTTDEVRVSNGCAPQLVRSYSHTHTHRATTRRWITITTRALRIPSLFLKAN
jgi:hypothetical protein